MKNYLGVRNRESGQTTGQIVGGVAAGLALIAGIAGINYFANGCTKEPSWNKKGPWIPYAGLTTTFAGPSNNSRLCIGDLARDVLVRADGVQYTIEDDARPLYEKMIFEANMYVKNARGECSLSPHQAYLLHTMIDAAKPVPVMAPILGPSSKPSEEFVITKVDLQEARRRGVSLDNIVKAAAKGLTVEDMADRLRSGKTFYDMIK